MNLLVPIYIIFTTMGLVFMKLGGDTLKLSLKPELLFSMNYKTLIGFVCYVISFVIWQKIIVTHNISSIFAITTGFIQIVVFIIGVLIFKEDIKILNIMGMLLIIGGISLIIK